MFRVAQWSAGHSMDDLANHLVLIARRGEQGSSRVDRATRIDPGRIVPALRDAGVTLLALDRSHPACATWTSAAASAGLPFVVATDAAALERLRLEVLESILDHQRTMLQREDEVHRFLVRIVLAGGSLRELCEALAVFFGGAAIVTTTDGRVLARAGGDYDRSLLLAAQALAMDPSPEAESDLFATLLRGDAVTVTLRAPGRAHSIAIAPDSRSVVGVTHAGDVVRWSVFGGPSSTLARLGQTPGEFSFNGVVGDRTEKEGYKIAHVISAGEMVDGLAGGTCQISTTLYGAAFFAGLDIVKQTPHSRPSTYVPMGFDATVVWPNTDLQLKNPYDFPVVIHYRVARGEAVVEILGKERPWDQVVWERHVLDTTPFETEERLDDSLPEGFTSFDQAGFKGYKLTRVRRFMKDGVEKKVEKWTVTYKPVTEYVRKGTSTNPDLKPPTPKPVHGPKAPGSSSLRITQ